jgi:hypothetical protein
VSTLGSWWLARTEALPEEKVLISCFANRTQSATRAVGGKLYITNLRVVFLPHLLDHFTGGDRFELRRASIESVYRRSAGGDTFGGGLRDRLAIKHDEGVDLFVVNTLDELIIHIRRVYALDPERPATSTSGPDTG